MKAVVAFAVLIAGISASIMPESGSQIGSIRSARFVTDSIISEIENISEQIKDAGLDPLHTKKEVFEYELPVPVIFNANALLEEVLSTGLSEIVVNNMNYNLFQSRLDFEIELPHIHLSARVANADATLFGNTLTVRADGRVDVRSLVVKGEVRVSIGIISGISISSVTIDLTVPSVATNIRLAIQGKNYSEQVNALISKTIPDTLKEFNAEVNELIEIILLDVINDML